MGRGVGRTICAVIIVWLIWALCVYVLGLAIWCSASSPSSRLWYITAYKSDGTTVIQYGSGDQRAYMDITATDNAGQIRYIFPYAITVDGQYYTIDQDKFVSSTIKWYDKSGGGSSLIYDGTILGTIPEGTSYAIGGAPADGYVQCYITIDNADDWQSSIYYTLWSSPDDSQGWIYISVTPSITPMPDNEVLEYLQGHYNNPAINPAISALDSVGQGIGDFAGEMSAAGSGLSNAVGRAMWASEEGITAIIARAGATVGGLIGGLNTLIQTSPIISALVGISVVMMVLIAILRKAGD